MYNYAYDTAIFNIKLTWSCPQSGGFHQDIQYCGAQACAGGGGGEGGSGGCCNGSVICSSGPGAGNEVCNGVSCVCTVATPIIIDVGGRGFNLTSGEEGVKFDILANGIPLKIAWTAKGSQNAFLALDRNGNGRIDSGAELFGNKTQQPASANPNGYLALAEFDKPENGGNDDGIIDSRDAIYSKLLLWVDSNHDGISQTNELHGLAELGVYSISLTYQDEHYTDEYGNWFHYRATINQGMASKDGRWSYDVIFRPDASALTCPNKGLAKKLDYLGKAD